MKNFDDIRNELKENDNATYIALEIVGSIMAARDRKEMSQRELSRISGVPQKTISRIEELTFLD
ncbi:helix-turn-helix domain-containing protein [Bacillus sp. Wb]